MQTLLKSAVRDRLSFILKDYSWTFRLSATRQLLTNQRQ